MDHGSKSKKELISELEELQVKYNSLKAICDPDITSRERGIDSLQKSGEHFRNFIEQAPIAMAIVSMDGVIEFINQKAITVFGYQPEDIPTMDNWWLLAYPDENYRKEVTGLWMGRVQTAIEEGREIAGQEFQVTCNGGTVKTIVISGVPVSNKIFVLFDDITERKILEEALKESEERFSKAYKTSPIAFMIANMDDGRIFEVNDAFTAVSGYAREEALASSTLNLKIWVHEEDRQHMLNTLRNGRAVIRQETKLRAKDGHIVTVLLSAQIIHLSQKPCIISSIEDITERKKAEEHILKINRVYAVISQINQTIVRTRDRAKLFEEVCHIAIEYGKFRMAWIGLIEEETHLLKIVSFAGVEDGYFSIIDKISPSDLMESFGPTGKAIRNKKHFVCDDIANEPVITALKDEALKRGYRSSISLPIITFGNVTGIYSIYASVPFFFDSEETILLNEVTSDISFALEALDTEKKRKETEESLQNITSRLETLIQVSPLAITLLDINDNVQIWNKAAENIFGWTAQEIIGHPNPLVPKYRQNEYIEWKSRIMEGKSLANLETERQRKDGSLIYISISTAPLYDKQGKVAGRMAIISDITERKRLDQELITAKEKAEESDRLKTAFLHNMSHEIRTPMNAIVGFCSLMVENYNNRTKLVDYSEIIYQSCNDLLVIINDILDIAKIESGQLTVNYEECRLNELFAELKTFFTEFQKRIGKQHINFSVHDCSDPLENIIITDKVKLKQIFFNLIGNSFKFTDSGKIESGCKFDNAGKLVFYVSDTGIGIPPDKQEVIFERFAQLNLGTDKLVTGTGLGLSIVKGLVELLGGKLWLESELENLPAAKPGGTTFYFSLPYETVSPSKHKQVQIDEKNEYHFTGKTVLIVEDDIYNAAYIKEILSNTGLKIIHTRFGAEAIQFAKNQLPDLILMDIRLPDINGYEVTRRIKQDKPNLKIIALTAYAGNDDKQKALDAGCNDYLSKPTKKNLLLSLISRHLS